MQWQAYPEEASALLWCPEIVRDLTQTSPDPQRTPAMARLPYIEKSQLPAEHQVLMTRDIALYKQLVHSPGALRAF
jgi:hypothetical protein